MKPLKIAYSKIGATLFSPLTEKECVPLETTDFSDVAAIVMTDQDITQFERIDALGIPVFLIRTSSQRVQSHPLRHRAHIIDTDVAQRESYMKDIASAAAEYEKKLLPPFFGALMEYVESQPVQFDCPGHQGGRFYTRHPAGKAFVDFYGETIFRSDLCNADVALGDLLIHEGPACRAQQEAARVFNADKTYFVLNGTSAANKMVLNAVLTQGDIVLYDRNNHKSISHGALIQAGATPVYLETARNPFGSIGGILDHCFDETYIRKLIGKRDPIKAQEKRPVRLAVIQLGTYDGCIYNARQVIDAIGHLCDYILFDSAWVGYEQFIPMLKECSPLLLELGPEDPGILVTQSVHKQQAGFSQASQVHKKDAHIKGQARYINHKRFNNAFMMHASTSPFYPLFASLDVNAKIHDGEMGRQLWKECVGRSIDARKAVLSQCHYIRPLIPPMVHGAPWQEGATHAMAEDISYFSLHPEARWHSFKGYGSGQYCMDPCKLQLITPGINVATGNYESFGIPATILANYLREHGVIPEKCDLNTILFLMTPAESADKMDRLLAALVQFETLIDQDAFMKEVLPSLYEAYHHRYRGYTIRQLCQEMHNFYKNRGMSSLQKKLFLYDYLPDYVTTPQVANIAFVRGEGELVTLANITNRIALEGALPYPPGVICVQPGERWSETARDYFLVLEAGLNQFPGFASEMQGVYIRRTAEGTREIEAYVWKKESAPFLDR
ncbi:ornithine decarboxylase [Veillonella montpellierensis]|uniref:ornithine decarboxylase n=1 Tax=Veillonella montpellierensis TaxID=187328 RepID=UPI0023F7BA8F|nr:ornithine decarboxylase [Veillonella montpellierensis]